MNSVGSIRRSVVYVPRADLPDRRLPLLPCGYQTQQPASACGPMVDPGGPRTLLLLLLASLLAMPSTAAVTPENIQARAAAIPSSWAMIEPNLYFELQRRTDPALFPFPVRVWS